MDTIWWVVIAVAAAVVLVAIAAQVVARSRRIPISVAMRLMSASCARSAAPERHATAAIMQSTRPLGVMPDRRQRR